MGERQKVLLKRVGIVSFAKFFGLLFLLLGIIYSITLAFLVDYLGNIIAPYLNNSTNPLTPGSSPPGISFSVKDPVFLAILPVWTGVLGVIYGIIVAFIYNLISSGEGGIELDFEEKTQEATYEPPEYQERTEKRDEYSSYP